MPDYNVSLLPKYAAPLRDAGVSHSNSSLNILRPTRFAMLTRMEPLEQTWAGIQTAQSAGSDRLN